MRLPQFRRTHLWTLAQRTPEYAAPSCNLAAWAGAQLLPIAPAW